jgi:para-nitrobenzyl esterase
MSSVVETVGGKVRGEEHTGVHAFKGIPYGDDTGGSNRFRAPQPAKPWVGAHDATRLGPRCPQMKLATRPDALGAEGFAFGPDEPEGENCLVLNVWTTATGDTARLPVMVWIHGGGFFGGSGGVPLYDGAALASRGDAVIVTLNFRLGILAFLYVAHLGGEGYAESGNLAQLDLVAGLQWVRENIAAFGGDPGNVTLFGESAGGTLIWTLMGTPAAEGLFHKAIVQSAPGHCWRSLGKAVTVTNEVVAELGLGGDPLEGLVSTPVERLLEAQGTVIEQRGGFTTHALVPTLDGIVVPELPAAAIAKGSAADVPLLVGTTRDEMRSLLGDLVEGPDIDDGEVRELVAPLVGDPTDDVVDAYRRARPTDAPKELFYDIYTDRHLRVPALQLAESKLAGGTARVYSYLFTWKSPAGGGAYGAFHALEVPFVFDTLGVMPAAQGPGSRALMDQMSTAWLRFAASGSPGHPRLPAWPPYSIEDRATMVLDESPRIENDPQGDVRNVWDGIVVDGSMTAPSLA